jgi:hypothetical protein
MRNNQLMKDSRNEVAKYFAYNQTIINRIQAYLQEKTDTKVWQEDVAHALRLPPNTLTVLKTRNAYSFLPFAVKWCIENDIDVKKFLLR